MRSLLFVALVAALLAIGSHARAADCTDANDCTTKCTANDAEACARLARMYAVAKGVPHDPAKAFSLSQKACDAKSQFGCVLEGWFYENGTGVERDESRAYLMFKEACDAKYID